MRSDLLGVLKCSLVLKIRRNSAGAERMATSGVGQSGIFCAALYHVENIAPRHRIAGELVSLANARK
jgi:hypothetical protein